MKLLTFAFVFLVLLASGALALGLEISSMKVNVEYSEALVYSGEDQYSRNRVSFADIPLANNTKINVDIFPGSNVTFTVTVENTLRGADQDMGDVFIRATIKEIDDGSDLEESSRDFDLEQGSQVREDLKFKIPTDIKPGTYKAIIESEGDGRNRTSYFASPFTFRLDVKKLSHDIRITRASFNPGIIDCKRKTALTAEIANAGTNREDQVAIEFRSAALGINSYDKDIVLERSDDSTPIEDRTHLKTLNIDLPIFFKEGTYPVYVNLYWKNFILFDQKIVNLVVKDCGSSGTTKSPINQQNNKTPSRANNETVPPADNNGTKDSSQGALILSFSTLLVLVLGGFIMVIVIALILYSRK